MCLANSIDFVQVFPVDFFRKQTVSPLLIKSYVYRVLAYMSESDYIDVLDKPFIYTVRLVIYANSLPECGMHISSIKFPDLEV